MRVDPFELGDWLIPALWRSSPPSTTPTRDSNHLDSKEGVGQRDDICGYREPVACVLPLVKWWVVAGNWRLQRGPLMIVCLPPLGFVNF
jgi:hypothetical protein